MIEDDLTLFEIEAKTTMPEVGDLPIRPEQVTKIRQAFEDAAIVGQQERKELVDAAATRDVPALRDLTAVEGRRVLRWIKSRAEASPKKDGSAWDMREEDTWIDKL